MRERVKAFCLSCHMRAMGAVRRVAGFVLAGILEHELLVAALVLVGLFLTVALAFDLEADTGSPTNPWTIAAGIGTGLGALWGGWKGAGLRIVRAEEKRESHEKHMEATTLQIVGAIGGLQTTAQRVSDDIRDLAKEHRKLLSRVGNLERKADVQPRADDL